MKKAVIFFVLAIVLISFCAAQSTNDAQRIVGTWVSENGITLVFNVSGTGTSSGFSVSSANGNIFWGLSISGGICIIYPNGLCSEKIYYLSPDGQRMIWNNYVLQKK